MKHWADPLSPASASGSTALIILNEAIPSVPFLEKLWSSAQHHLCADGGANRLYDLLSEAQRSQYLPNLIKGDLDSLRDEVADWYRQKGVDVVRDGDQYSTDLQKCLNSLKETSCSRILLLGGLTGRLDQTAHTLSILHKLRASRQIIWAFSELSMACALDTGTHRITINKQYTGPTCGILPVGCTVAHITTKGLRWDVDNWETSFDSQMSTSNHLREDVVDITTDQPVTWTCELRPFH